MNPVTAPQIQRYPERRSDGGQSQIWHGDKLLKEVPLDQLCPHYICGARQFYINEYAQLKDTRMVIPCRWIMIDGVLHTEVWMVERHIIQRSLPMSDSSPKVLVLHSGMLRARFTRVFYMGLE
jgi:hypothetical protein